VYEVTQAAVTRARRGEGPTLIEAKTYRFDEHQVGLNTHGDPYRAPEEVREYIQNRDPLTLFKPELLKSGVSEAEIRAIEEEAAEAVARAIEFARKSPLPEPSDVYQYMYVTPINYPPQPFGART
jgi:pyruvate dehydrogenase E1 component alpha subunit